MGDRCWECGGMDFVCAPCTYEPLLARVAELEVERDQYLIAAMRLHAWAGSMPDAGFTDQSPRWDWWHRRPRPDLNGGILATISLEEAFERGFLASASAPKED